MSFDHLRAELETLTRDYLAVHVPKEELFWATYMATSDDHEGFAKAESAWKAHIADPERLTKVRTLREELHQTALAKRAGPSLAAGFNSEEEELQTAIDGWEHFYATNTLESPQSRTAMDALIDQEARLFAERQGHTPRHTTEAGPDQSATLSSLATNLATNADEAARRSSYQAFRDLEQWVLDHGFLDIVKQRNALARSAGSRNYFDFKVERNEAMTASQLFAILEDFEHRTRSALDRTLTNLSATHGPGAREAWNLRFFSTGDISRQLDPYLGFASAVDRWVRSFKALGIRFRGATLQLDLLEREGKFQNGFCHAPLPPYVDSQGHWVPARVNFTSDAKPDQIGSGDRALNTLFHEGGHAAHFANITMNAPCFSMEYAPTSMAYAETQSMFCDSLLDDADWLDRYATDSQGATIPTHLIRDRVTADTPMNAFNERQILLVPWFERRLYNLSDAELTPDAVLSLARRCEQEILGMDSPRPLLAIPHLLNQESAASYHGYLLAHMAVWQTRAFFLQRDGYLTDNPRIGGDLAAHYWACGNSRSHDQTLRNLTGSGFSATALATYCNLDAEAAWKAQEALLKAARGRKQPDLTGVSLDASIRLVHGSQLLADNAKGDEAMVSDFAAVVRQRFGGR